MKKGRRRFSEEGKLIHHLEPFKHLCVDDTVNRLRSKYPSFYQRIKLPVFTRKVEKTLASLSFKQRSMTKQSRISSVESQEEEIAQENIHKKRRLNYAASEEGSGEEGSSDEGSSDEGSGEEGSDEEGSDEKGSGSSLEYAVPKISRSSSFGPRGVQMNSGIGESVRFSDLGGMEKALHELERFVMLPFRHPELAILLGVKPISGILLHGPPGCGKTKLAHAIANEIGIPFHKTCATNLVSSVTGIYLTFLRFIFTFTDVIGWACEL